ncbi:glycosyltransferase [Spirosoma pollinicola]|uniref:Glycosyl transferase family 2 n=1 Tax=Spirosoma pollinicola TaxID=2057025 RepID=A0A2K8Z235_9BACT|nr:glycosyltransferase [Spirosoma pollinicola]AUD03947.1 glycosyl transferase family 2 [Spirosoma pollinicola]
MTQRTTISIALCTYNGIAYLPMQWQSLLDQEQLPDEIVICDDQSTDGTAELLAELAAKAPFVVRIISNPVRLGSDKNFELALAACTGDLIFICDQDDFWLPEKIATMTRFMAQHASVQVAFCDAYITDENLEKGTDRVWEAVRFDTIAQTRWASGEALEILLDGNRMMGCATVIRKPFIKIILPVPTDLPGDYIYDGWIALVAAAYSSIAYIDRPLQLYRTHLQQQVGVGPRVQELSERIRLRDRVTRHRARKLAPLEGKYLLLTKLSQLLLERVPADLPSLAQLRRRLAHFTMRSSLPHNRLKRFVPVLCSLQQGNYKRYADASANWYAPYLAVLGDIFE